MRAGTNIEEAAERLSREYRAMAAQECEARILYHAMEGNAAAAAHWRRVKDALAQAAQDAPPSSA